MNSFLVLVRHGESEWNAKGVWTGLTDIGLTQKGKAEAAAAARALSDIRFDLAVSSPLLRAKDTRTIILHTLHQEQVALAESPAINERDYGVYTGKNKWEIQKELGDDAFLKLRRGWDYPVEKGESLKMVYQRVVPYYEAEILPLLKQGKNILITAHGNSLRALMKYLDGVSDEDVAAIELATGEIVVYRIDTEGRVVDRSRRSAV